MRKSAIATIALLLLSHAPARAQVGPVLYEDQFNTLDHWLKVTGNGDWGWGNGELEFYKNENVDIADVPGEPGNKALRIIAKRESGPGIVDQWGNALNFTSGKVSSKSFLSVKYGMIETRVRVPDLNLGGWPAFWMLGTSNYTWPDCGEVDFMEMGGAQAFRNAHDSHNGGNGLHNSTVNQMVGANAIYGSNGVVSIASDPTDTFNRPYYNYAKPLNGRFLIYRVYWDDTSMRFTVTDEGVERDLYTHPFVFGADAEELKQPMFLLANLAIGGAFTDCYRLGDPASGLPVTMATPDTMYVDYVRVSQWNGKGEVTLGPPTPQGGVFGVFTDNTPTNASLQAGSTSQVYVWSNTLVPGTIAPFEGANALSYKTNAQGWFGGGVLSVQPVNLFNFGTGSLKFRVKMPANVTFKIGVIDTWGNQNYVDFPAGQTKYGLVRNGQWGQASIPVSDLRGLAIDLRMLSYEFVMLETNGTAAEFAFDDIYWDGGTVVAGVGDGASTTKHAVLLGNSPNPFRSSTALRFELPAAGPYELDVFDVAGKRVSHFRGIGQPGANIVPWNGRDEQGRDTKAGVYYYRLSAGGATSSRKVVRLQ